jgi:hypothetical protein
VKFGMVICHKYTYKFCMNYCLEVNNCKYGDNEISEVISDIESLYGLSQGFLNFLVAPPLVGVVGFNGPPPPN